MRVGRSILGPVRPIDSTSAGSMNPEMASYVLRELRRRRSLPPYGHVALAATIVVVAATAVLQWFVASIVLGLLGASATIWLFRWRVSESIFSMHYQLDGEINVAFERLIASVTKLGKAERLWLVEAEARVFDGRYDSNARRALHRSRITPRMAAPPGVRTNVATPMLRVGKQTLYFFPDRVLMYDATNIGAIEYVDLEVVLGVEHYVDDEASPSDAKISGMAWKYANVDGSPDRRFSGNYQRPIVQYTSVELWSKSGLNERLQVSSATAAQAFADGLRGMTAAHAARLRGVGDGSGEA